MPGRRPAGRRADHAARHLNRSIRDLGAAVPCRPVTSGRTDYQGPYGPELVARVVFGEAPHLGAYVGQVDGRRDERRDRQDRGRAHAVHRAGQPDHGGHAEDDQPQRLGLLARGHEGLLRPGDGVDEGPRLDAERHQAQGQEEVGKRCSTRNQTQDHAT